MTDAELQRMRVRAMRWIEPGGCAPVTRDTALNEEHLALDVVELCAEVERLSDACRFGERTCAQLVSERDDAVRERNAMRDVAVKCHAKLGYLLRDYPGDKETAALLEALHALLVKP